MCHYILLQSYSKLRRWFQRQFVFLKSEDLLNYSKSYKVFQNVFLMYDCSFLFNLASRFRKLLFYNFFLIIIKNFLLRYKICAFPHIHIYAFNPTHLRMLLFKNYESNDSYIFREKKTERSFRKCDLNSIFEAVQFYKGHHLACQPISS